MSDLFRWSEIGSQLSPDMKIVAPSKNAGYCSRPCLVSQCQILLYSLHFPFFVPSFLSHSHSLLHPTMPNPQNPGPIISRLLPHGTGPWMPTGCQQFARLLWVWLCLGLLPFWVAWDGLITCHLAHRGARKCISLSFSLSSYQDWRLDFEIHFGIFNFSAFWLDSLDYTCRRFVLVFWIFKRSSHFEGVLFQTPSVRKMLLWASA